MIVSRGGVCPPEYRVFIQPINKIWKTIYFFDNIRHSSTSFDLSPQIATVVFLKEKILYTVFSFIRRISF